MPKSNGKIEIFAVGLLIIMFEILFTRIASAFFQYHFAFVALSLAMLSIFASGVAFNKFNSKQREEVAKSCFTILPVCFILTFISFILLGVNAILFIIFGLLILFICSFLTIYLLNKETRSDIMYGLNLFGGAVGALFAIVVLMTSNPFMGLIFCSILSSTINISKVRKMAIVMLIISALLLPMTSSVITDSEPLWQKWNSFSLVKVYDRSTAALMWGGIENNTTDLPDMYELTIDSNAATAIVLEPDKADIITKDITHFGYYFIKNDSEVAIIGSGGGRDVIGASKFQPTNIVAIEINPIVIEATDIYSPETYEEVDVVIGDGREVIEKNNKRFDFIQLSLVDTWAAVASGSFALTENYLYTTEAMRIFIDKLNDDGIVSITHHTNLDKLVGISRSALAETHAENWEDHIVLIKSTNSEFGGEIYTLLLKKNEWHDEELEKVAVKANELGFEIVGQTEFKDEGIPSDDSPFFFFNPIGKIVLGTILLLLALVASLAASFLRVDIRKMKLDQFMFFSLIGLGYMFIENTILQKMFLTIHDPTLAISTVLLSFLFFSGVGSILSNRFGFKSAIMIIPLLLIFILLQHVFQDVTMGLPVFFRALLASLIIAPLAFFMGIFFPQAFQAVKKNNPENVGSVWAINGFFSVVSPTLSLIVAIAIGFNFLLVLSAVIYGFAWYFGMKIVRNR